MRTRGWVIKHSKDYENGYWTGPDSYKSERSGRDNAYVFLTRFEAFAALYRLREYIKGPAACCKVYRLTSRRKTK